MRFEERSRRARLVFWGGVAAVVLGIAGLVVWMGFAMEDWDAFQNHCFDQLHGWTEAHGWGGLGQACVVDGKVVGTQ